MSQWDDDIAKLIISDEEKNGLQVFRNYSTAFDAHRAKKFVSRINQQEHRVGGVTRIHALIEKEDVRFLPVIVCAYADDQLNAMFRREIPESVPGGRQSLLSGFGPLSRFSQRIQIAYSFGWLSKDLLEEFEHVRKLRNDIAHKWDIVALTARWSDVVENKMAQIETTLADDVSLPKGFYETLNADGRFRVRLIWMVGRLFYECICYPPALKERLSPNEVLYGKERPELLVKVAEQCVEATRRVLSSPA